MIRSFLICSLTSIFIVFELFWGRVQILAKSDAASALQLAPTNATALINTNWSRIDTHRIDDIQSAIKQPIAQSALRAEPFTQLALLELKSGNDQTAKTYFQTAQKRNPRSRGAARGLFDLNVKEEDYGGALDQLDLLLRLDRRLSNEYFATLLPFAQNPRAQSALKEKLVQGASWAPQFLSYLTNQIVPAKFMAELIQETPFNDPQMRTKLQSSFLTKMLQKGNYQNAKSYWEAFVGLETTRPELPYDNLFESKPGPLPFNWRLINSATHSAELIKPGLHGYFSGNRTTVLAEQYVSLPVDIPHQLSVRADHNIRRRHGHFSWRLVCHPDNQILAKLEFSGVSTGLRRTTNAFKIDHETCPLQKLQLLGIVGEYTSGITLTTHAVLLEPIPS